MTKETVKIEGMTCDMCVKHVTEALESVEGVQSAKVSLKKNEAVIKHDETANIDKMAAAVEAAGYKYVK